MDNLSRLREEYDQLVDKFKIADRRASVSDSKETRIHIEELEQRVKNIRSQYGQVNTMRHPNIVIADLALLQGQEIDALDQLRMWKHAKETKNMLAKQMEICENNIKRIEEDQ